MSTITATALRSLDLDRFNLAPNSRNFDCKFLEPGFVSYRDVGGKLELLRKETIDRCMNSVIGTPLIVGHTDVTPENRADLEHGTITEWYFNSEDGWYHVKGQADTDRAVELIRIGWKPSCGYRVVGLQVGGMDHGIRYDQEISDLEFNHLAIVERPRYAGSDFRLNSHQQPMNVFKLLKKLVTRENGADGKPVESVKTEATEISGDTEVEVNGQKVRLNELFQTYLDETARAITITPEDALEVSGKAVTMGDLAAAHKAATARVNTAPVIPAGETAEQKLAREKTESEKRENDKAAFFTLHTARSAAKVNGGFSTTAGSLKEKCELGAKRY